jgi:methylthioribose-1-phosphate isomerase
MRNSIDSLDLPPLAWSVRIEEDRIMILDESALPETKVYVPARDYEEAARAIAEMKTRAFGQVLTVFYALLLTLRKSNGLSPEKALGNLQDAAQALEKARPTFPFKDLNRQVLHWAEEALQQGNDFFGVMEERILDYLGGLRKARLTRARLAAEILEDGDRILTHCNVSGEMVLIGRCCREQGKRIEFYATETRPYLQGRLTAWELHEDQLPVTLVADNAVGALFSKGVVDRVIVGSDRSAQNGDIVNKVGTYQIAVMARHYGVPFYALSQDTGKTAEGKEIIIEERDPEEILVFRGQRIFPEGINAFYPAFDLTPADYITRLITLKEVIAPPDLGESHTKSSSIPPGKPFQIMVYGLPGKEFYEAFPQEYPQEAGWEIVIPEGRPDLAPGNEVSTEFRDLGYPVSIVTDNMVGHCLQQGRIKEVHLFCQKRGGKKPVARAGSLAASILARENSVSCRWHQVLSFPGSSSVGDISIGGRDILVAGVESFYPLYEEVVL